MRRLVIVGALLALAAPARADWQYTHWGMSVDEVVKASKGAAVPLESGDAQHVRPGVGAEARLKAPYKAGEYQFRAFFYFDGAGKLTLVDVSSDDLDPYGASRAIVAELRAKYGPPLRDRPGWIEWQDSGNAIEYRDVNGKLPAITYRARVTEMNKGL